MLKFNVGYQITTHLFKEILWWYGQMMKKIVQELQEVTNWQWHSMWYKGGVGNWYESFHTVLHKIIPLTHWKIVKNEEKQLEMFHIKIYEERM